VLSRHHQNYGKLVEQRQLKQFDSKQSLKSKFVNVNEMLQQSKSVKKNVFGPKEVYNTNKISPRSTKHLDLEVKSIVGSIKRNSAMMRNTTQDA
jgi:hypothetical protein